MTTTMMENEFMARLMGIPNWVRTNPWTSLFILIAAHYVFKNFVQPLLQELLDKWAFDPNRTTKLQEEMKQIREWQQEKARERAIEADKVRKEKEEEEKAKKRAELERQRLKGGTRLGGEHSKPKKDPSAGRQQSTPNRSNPPLPWSAGDDNVHTIADVAPASNGPTSSTTSGGNQGNGNWNTTGTTFMTPDDRWARAERAARFRRNAGPRPQPGEAPSSRGNWGR